MQPLNAATCGLHSYHPPTPGWLQMGGKSFPLPSTLQDASQAAHPAFCFFLKILCTQLWGKNQLKNKKLKKQQTRRRYIITKILPSTCSQGNYNSQQSPFSAHAAGRHNLGKIFKWAILLLKTRISAKCDLSLYNNTTFFFLNFQF